MPIAKVKTACLKGLNILPVTVEVNIESRGFPSFNIVGLASKEIEESKLRIRSAIDNSKYEFPTNKKITVNMAPANVPKTGSFYDLPITIGILKASNQLTCDLSKKSFFGELSLDGKIKEVNGIAVVKDICKNKNTNYLYIPHKNVSEVFFKNNKNYIRPAKSLYEVISHLQGIKIMPVFKQREKKVQNKYEILIEDIKDQEQAKRAITIVAAGNHNISLSGPPGTGKSMIAKAAQSILPDLSFDEVEEVVKIQSIVGETKVSLNNRVRPFRSPHHTTSRIGLIGGGTNIKPGEITLAHRGILFLDELNEFPRSIIESLRQPLEDKQVSISRVSGNLTFPASFMLIVANNPCPCGYLNSNLKECKCKINEIKKYQQKVSGPIWDRIDLHVIMKEFDVKKLKFKQTSSYGRATQKIKEKVINARNIQLNRYKGEKYKTNAEQSNKNIYEKSLFSKKAKNTLDIFSEKIGLSPRGYFKSLKVARTIADLENSKLLKEEHILEALSYREVKQF